MHAHKTDQINFLPVPWLVERGRMNTGVLVTKTNDLVFARWETREESRAKRRDMFSSCAVCLSPFWSQVQRGAQSGSLLVQYHRWHIQGHASLNRFYFAQTSALGLPPNASWSVVKQAYRYYLGESWTKGYFLQQGHWNSLALHLISFVTTSPLLGNQRNTA